LRFLLHFISWRYAHRFISIGSNFVSNSDTSHIYFGIVIIPVKWLGHLDGSYVTFRDFLPDCVKKFHTYCLRSMNYAGCTMQWHYVKFHYLQNIKNSTILWKLKNANHIILNFIYNIWVSLSQICLSYCFWFYVDKFGIWNPKVVLMIRGDTEWDCCNM